MYKIEGNDVLEYRIIPEREEVIRRITIEDLAKEKVIIENDIENYDVIVYGTNGLESLQTKLSDIINILN